MDNVFDGYKCPICNGTLRITKRLLNCGYNEWHELNRIVCNHCKVKSVEMECDLKQYKEEYWNSFNEAVKRKKERETRKPEKILTDIRDYLVERKAKCGNEKYEIHQIMGLGVEVFVDKALDDLTEYAEKLGVEL
jgi:hypothetical protein